MLVLHTYVAGHMIYQEMCLKLVRMCSMQAGYGKLILDQWYETQPSKIRHVTTTMSYLHKGQTLIELSAK